MDISSSTGVVPRSLVLIGYEETREKISLNDSFKQRREARLTLAAFIHMMFDNNCESFASLKSAVSIRFWSIGCFRWHQQFLKN